MSLAASKSTTTTVINAAFLQEVKESNPQLWSTLHQLREMVNGPLPAAEANQFVDLLDGLRESLALQFSLEETYGFLEAAPVQAATPQGDARRAKTQHRELYLQVHELCEEVEQAQYRGTIGRDLKTYVEGYQAFDAALRDHEDLEAELIRNGLGMVR